MIVWFVIMIGLIAGCVWIGERHFRHAEHGTAKVTSISFIVAGWLWLAWFAVSFISPRIGAEVITKVPVDDDLMYECHTVLYDSEENRYFYTRDSLWNPFMMIYRVYLDTEKVERYIEIERGLKDIDLFG